MTRDADVDEVDFERSVTPQVSRLFGLAMTILADRGEAEDAVQETMISAWKSRNQLRDEAKRSAWLTRICVNHCIHRRRGLLRRTLWSGEGEFAAVPADPTVQFEGRLLDFNRAFMNLSPSQRAAFALHVQHGYTLNECATFMGCRPGTARSHLGRAVASLRREMSNAE